MSTGPSSVEQALAAGLAPGGDLVAALRALPDDLVLGLDDIEAVGKALSGLTGRTVAVRDGDGFSALRLLAVLVRKVDSREAFDALRAQAVPHLIRLYDERLAAGPADALDEDDLILTLQSAAMFYGDGVVERLAAAAAVPMASGNESLWWAVFSAFDTNHPHRVRLARSFGDSPPPPPVDLVYLAFVNALAREGTIASHLFQSESAMDRLAGWLTDPSARPKAYLAAAQALAFLGGPRRDGLLAVAANHRDARVRIEAARVGARRGEEASVGMLVEACHDPRVSRAAGQALRSLDKGGLIPARAAEADFRALAELAHWLAHPGEFDRPPDEVSLLDTRETDWPPSNDCRRLWLVGYRYDDAGDGLPFEGSGLVGSLTYSNRDEPRAGRSVDDLYALHCVWELQIRHDPRAPAEATVEAGHALLGPPV